MSSMPLPCFWRCADIKRDWNVQRLFAVFAVHVLAVFWIPPDSSAKVKAASIHTAALAFFLIILFWRMPPFGGSTVPKLGDNCELFVVVFHCEFRMWPHFYRLSSRSCSKINFDDSQRRWRWKTWMSEWMKNLITFSLWSAMQDRKREKKRSE